MKLDRNINGNGRGKYALLKLRNLETVGPHTARSVGEAMKTLEDAGILDWGIAGTEAEFMLIRLKDRYALPALLAYAGAAEVDDPEYAAEIYEMSNRAGVASPWCKRPD